MSLAARAARVDPYADRVDHGALRFLHRLNPLAKIAAPLPAMIALVFTRDLAVPLAFIALAYLLLLVGAKLSGRAALGLFVVLPALSAVLAFSIGLWTAPSRTEGTPVLFAIGSFDYTLGALTAGAATALRLGGILVLSLLAGLTSTGPDLVRAMVQQLRVPYRLGYTALAAYRFVPRFGHELDVIRQAHRVRGVSTGRGPVAAVRRWLGYVVPLLAGALRHAERVALAMDSRAFGAHPTRTERHLVPFRARDWVFMLAFWAATAAILVAGAVLPR
ncbi:energy-coupling factor transporter transmembrane protein EcfT [Herbiconiux moechotypicola]|uniref:HMP/thiamine ABC transporter permease ThiX n=1 Tax=Herbiconiux moechotypicola TaxID=637393 RepID=A0ABN3DLQ5_9MICO|nr:energy-coupling factor transporter transmembrane component T [Herbiconiux moechotypicola]MCS5730194.1 energy-coupling factor transporter transmembrane protein EcfT [Herbiconiux moechotypicola]